MIRAWRRPRCTAAPVLLAVLLAGCTAVSAKRAATGRPLNAEAGNAVERSPSASVSHTATTPLPSAAAAHECRANQLAFNVVLLAGAAGTDGGVLVARKRGVRPCYLKGWAHLTAHAQSGKQRATARPIRPGRRPSTLLGPGPRPVRILMREPGSKAVSYMSWGETPSPQTPCLNGHRLTIRPPHSTGRVTIPARILDCGNFVVQAFRGPKFVSTP